MAHETERRSGTYTGAYEGPGDMPGMRAGDPSLSGTFAGVHEETEGRGRGAMGEPRGTETRGTGMMRPYQAPYPAERGTSEHTWRGGLLGWVGAGIRASAAWFGQIMQGIGARMGGTVSGGSAELGRALQGRGEQMGSALERRGERGTRGQYPREGRVPRAYRRPDDRILDDVYQRISTAGVDADEVEIEVSEGVVKLTGRVPTRFDRRTIEDVAEQVFGVLAVHNLLRVAPRAWREEQGEARPEILSGDGRNLTQEHRPEGQA